MSEPVTEADADRTEHEIYVSAEAELVWELVSRPGWWINDGDVDDSPALKTEDDFSVLTHPEWGDFAITTVAAQRPEKVSYRWLSGPSEDVESAADFAEVHAASTLVEFSIETKPGGVSLRVVETGFASIDEDPEQCAAQRDQNAEGWANELRAARDFVTAHRG